MTDQLDGPVPVDHTLVKQIRLRVNSSIEDHESANGALTSEQQKQMATNLIMRELEQHTFTTATEGGLRMSAEDELAVRDAVLRQMFGLGATPPAAAAARLIARSSRVHRAFIACGCAARGPRSSPGGSAAAAGCERHGIAPGAH